MARKAAEYAGVRARRRGRRRTKVVCGYAGSTADGAEEDVRKKTVEKRRLKENSWKKTVERKQLKANGKFGKPEK